MDVFLWVLQGVLAVAFGMAGSMKLTQPKEKLATNMGWVEDFSAGSVKAIGALELAAAVGLIVPPLLDIAPVLSPLAAVGLIVTMIGAAVVHGRRNESQMIAVNVVLLIVAAVVAWGRFGPYSF